MAQKLANREREKYERVWATLPGYRRFSPAETVIAEVWQKWGNPKGVSVGDWGCGTGRATAWVRAAGCDVLAIDHAENCLDLGIGVPFLRACLWGDETRLLRFDYSVCCDVMEHIPRTHVGAVLRRIFACTDRKAFFRIAHGPDSALWGETLHLTLMSREEWRKALVEVGWTIEDEVPAADEYATGYFCRKG